MYIKFFFVKLHIIKYILHIIKNYIKLYEKIKYLFISLNSFNKIDIAKLELTVFL